MILADYYTRAGTMWVFLAIAVICFIVWGIAASGKRARRVNARRKANRTLKSVGYASERQR